MRKFLYTILTVFTMASVACSPEALDTYPAASLSPDQIFANSTAAQSALDGIYGLMYFNDWTTGWQDEKPGLQSFVLTHSLMGEDMFMYASGSGWFWYDYQLLTDGDWIDPRGRQSGNWEMFYTFIAQANYIIDSEANLTSDAAGMDVLGQAYAIRAYSYFCLYDCFCIGDYTSNTDEPGVPIYTKGTDKNTDGVGRGTIRQLYDQIYADFGKSIEYFQQGTYSQSHPSHIDYYVAQGLWARAALSRQDYAQAKTSATEALKKPGLTRVASLSALTGFNNRSAADVMWAFEITADQAAIYGSFISHMAMDGTYGASAPMCIDYWLYEEGMSDTDLRKSWAEVNYNLNPDGDYIMVDEDGEYFKDATGKVIYEYADNPGNYYTDNAASVTLPGTAYRDCFYWQNKFQYQNATTGVADVINMRAEEMLLTLAECHVRDGEYQDAIDLLKELYNQRYSAERNISTLTQSQTAISPDTYSQPATLLDEVLLQRRIELWCEGTGRSTDLRRLGLGYTRSGRQPNPGVSSVSANYGGFVCLIPLTEFDSNPALDLAVDQNDY